MPAKPPERIITEFPYPEITEVQAWLGLVNARNNRPWIPHQTDDEKSLVKFKYTLNALDIGWLFAEKKFGGIPLRILKDTHFMFAETIILKTGGNQFHHQRCSAAWATDYVQPFHIIHQIPG